MKRTYIIPNKRVSVKGSCKGLLTNGRGSYFVINNESSYQGWVVLQQKQWRMLKILEELKVEGSGGCEEIIYQQYNLQRRFKNGARDAITMYNNSLLYSHVKVKSLKIILDHREIYEESKFGRFYDIIEDKEHLIIHFKKDFNEELRSRKNGLEEQNILHNTKTEFDGSFDHYIVIKGFKNIKKICSWKKKTYSEDTNRNSRDTFWVYEAISLEPKNQLVFAQANSLNEAKILADISYVNFEEILNDLHENSLRETTSFSNNKFDEQETAQALAANSLLNLTQIIGENYVTRGIFAGYPWFYQLWSRDELISLGGLLTIAKKNYFQGKEQIIISTILGTKKRELLHRVDHKHLFTIYSILKRHIHSIQQDGLLDNRFPESSLGSVDSIGWLAKRIIDFISLLREENHLYNIFSIAELIDWKDRLFASLKKLKESRISDIGLLENYSKETWMDTQYHDDGRAGYRIEIQALFYNLYSAILLLDSLTDNNLKKDLLVEQKSLKKTIRSFFLKKKTISSKQELVLLDGLSKSLKEDDTIRPNVFLALYLAPELFTKVERRKIIRFHLDKLYLSWGGVSSIDKTHQLFQPKHTGHDNTSYHRGDSWFFINNIVGIVLLNEGSIFQKEYELIFNAGVKDILEHGYAGHMSELSSASVQDANGCHAQAWSVGTFVEFSNLLFPDDE